MARSKLNQQNIDNSDPTNYPQGRIRDNDGSGNGTPVNEVVYGDIQEFFVAMMTRARLNYNGLPDNTTNRHQYLEALGLIPSKNDILVTITSQVVSGGNQIVLQGLNTNQIVDKEVLFSVAPFNYNNHLFLTGSITGSSNKALNHTGEAFKQGDLIAFIANTTNGIDDADSQYLVTRICTGANIDTMVTELLYLKAATQTQENIGIANNVATTPLTNLTAFSRRVTGSDSGNYLAEITRNGLYPMTHFSFLANLISNGIPGVPLVSGTVDIGDLEPPTGVTGNITSATRIAPTGSGPSSVVTVYQINFNSIGTTNYQPIVTVMDNRLNATTQADFVHLMVSDFTATSFRIKVLQVFTPIQNITLMVKLLPN